MMKEKTIAAMTAVLMSFLVSGAAGLDYATPESQGVASAAIQRWIEACEQNAALNGYVHGFVIVRHGKIIAEGSWAPQRTLDRPHKLCSHSKSFTSTAIGFLVDDGKLDLDERVIDILPDKAPAEPGENLRRLRVRDLLTMNTGASCTDAQTKNVRGDWAKTLLANGFERSPGTIFKYDSGATYLLAEIAERKSGRRLMDFLKERLFDPLEMKSPRFTFSPSGVSCGGWGMYMTTRDLARFGQFLLQGGTWNGEHLLSEEWVTLASSRQTWSGDINVAKKAVDSGGDWNQGYGFQFWRCRPRGVYRADGAGGQFTVVFPHEDAVVSVHAGLGNVQQELNFIWDLLLPAFGNSALAENPIPVAALKAKCASLALPLTDPTPAVFEGMDKAKCSPTEDGWCLRLGDRTLAVGKGKWLVTQWKYSEDLVEPLFFDCGTHEIAAAGQLENGSLRVSWQMLGGYRHGSFSVGL